MKIHQLALLFLITSSFSSAEDAEKKVAMTGISKVEQIIGYLNKPYGTIVDVEGRVELDPPVKGNTKGAQDRYFLVTHANGQKLEQAIRFDLFFNNLPNAKHGDVIKAKAYERLMMFGEPWGLPNDGKIPSQGTGGYMLYRYLHILPDSRKVLGDFPTKE
jgi:hypothetical protein